MDIMARSLAFVAPSASLSPSLVATCSLFRPRNNNNCNNNQCTAVVSFPRFQSKPSFDDEDFFLQQELARIESLDSSSSNNNNSTVQPEDDDDDDWTALHDFDDLQFPNDDELEEFERTLFGMQLEPKSAATLEQALRQGLVPADAGVGSASLAGDFGFDPLHLVDKDYIGQVQNFIIHLIPGETPTQQQQQQQDRPKALILRDYREAEIRHGRLAMLAAVFWPLQEMLDRLVLQEFDSVVGNLVKGGITLPYIPLCMTAIMLLLGYLDIFRQQIKDTEELGEAFEPGDCFWDPLHMLEGAPDSMKRNMQERELFNARMAMIAIAVYIWEETRRGQPIISIPGNELLFEPAYQVPYIQEWLDSLFGSATPPTLIVPLDDVFPEGSGVSLDHVTGME
jgi:hypothetical protein